jgi:hypothetical protein
MITQIAELPDNPEPPATEEKKPFSDDPLDKQERLMDKYLEKVAKIQNRPPGGMFMAPPYPNEHSDGASLSQNIKITAADYDDLAAILKKFSDAARELHAVPDSVVSAAAGMPTVSWG